MIIVVGYALAIALTAYRLGVLVERSRWKRPSLDDIIDESWRKAVRDTGLGRRDS